MGVSLLIAIKPIAAAVDQSAAVEHENIPLIEPHSHQQIDTGNGRGAGADDDQSRLADIPSCQMERIAQCRCDDHGRAVLIVVHDWYLHLGLQPLLDVETFGRLDVFQIDPAKCGLKCTHNIDEAIRVESVEFDVECIDPGQKLEENAFALHHRLRRQRTDGAKTQYGSAVGDDGDQIRSTRVICGLRRIPSDFHRNFANAGCIGEAEIRPRFDWLGRDNFDFPGPGLGVIIQRRANQIFVQLCLLLRSSGRQELAINFIGCLVADSFRRPS